MDKPSSDHQTVDVSVCAWLDTPKCQGSHFKASFPGRFDGSYLNQNFIIRDERQFGRRVDHASLCTVTSQYKIQPLIFLSQRLNTMHICDAWLFRMNHLWINMTSRGAAGRRTLLDCSVNNMAVATGGGDLAKGSPLMSQTFSQPEIATVKKGFAGGN